MRGLPIARCFGSFCAGVAGVRPAPFAAFSLIGTAAWATGLTLLAYQLGPAFRGVLHTFTLPGIVLSVLVLAALIAHRVYLLRRPRYRGAGPSATGRHAS
jgi:membrane protein DedA with SNARE-associated domain